MPVSAILHIRLFGNLSIFTPETEPVQIPPSRVGALLALLAIESSNPHPCTREKIIDALWPEDDPDEARHKLRQTLYDVRRHIAGLNLDPDHVLIATRASLQLYPDCISVDTAMFESELNAASTEPNLRIQADLLAKAVDSYAGELLPGYYQERFIAEKTRLEEKFHGALNSLALAYEKMEQYDQGIEAARRLVALNLLNEEAHFTLMRLYAATGQPSSVLKQYQLLERALTDELGEAPSRSAQGVMESLRETAMARATAREVRPAHKRLDATEIEATDPESMVPIEGAKTADPSQPVHPRKAHVSRWHRIRVAFIAGPAVGIALALIILVSVKRRHFSNAIPPRTSASVAPLSRASILARYAPEADERGSEPTAITADNVGNLYVAGFVQTAHTDADFMTLKYDPTGRLLWRSRYDGTGHDVDRLRCIAVDSAGNVFVSGESDNGHGNGSTRLSGLDVVTIKYSPDGKELWQDRYNDKDNGDDRPVKMVVDSSGDSYVLCNCRRLRGGKDAGSNFVLIKYSPAGKRLWRKRYDGEAHSDDVPTGMALFSKDSGVCVCGYSRAIYKTGPEYDYLTIKYSANGNRIWTERYGANDQADDYARDVTADQDGNVYVVGEGRGLPGTPDELKTGCIMVKYSPSGEMLWARGTVNDSDRLQRVTATVFWNDGYCAVAGPAINKNGTTMYRVVLRDVDGQCERTEDIPAYFHPAASAPCALVNWPEESLHDAVWMVGSRKPISGSLVELCAARVSPHEGLVWQEGFSPTNGLNGARAAARCHRGNLTVIVVAGLCMDKHEVGGITLVEYSE